MSGTHALKYTNCNFICCLYGCWTWSVKSGERTRTVFGRCSPGVYQRQECEAQQFVHIPLSLQRSEQPASSLQAAEINEFYTGNVQQPPHTRLLSCHIERQKNYRMGQFELRAPRTKYRNLQPVHLTFSQISKPLMKQQIERNYSKRLS